MRRVRHLEQCDYIIPIRQKTSRVLVLSGQHNVFLERTWHDKNKRIELQAHARFDASLMNGIMAKCRLSKNGNSLSSTFVSAQLNRISDVNWNETPVALITMTEVSNGLFTGYVDQATLGLNELSGRESYSITFKLHRVRQTYAKKLFFNHIGVFDSVNRLRQQSEYLEVMKVDE